MKFIRFSSAFVFKKICHPFPFQLFIPSSELYLLNFMFVLLRARPLTNLSNPFVAKFVFLDYHLTEQLVQQQETVCQELDFETCIPTERVFCLFTSNTQQRV